MLKYAIGRHWKFFKYLKAKVSNSVGVLGHIEKRRSPSWLMYGVRRA